MFNIRPALYGLLLTACGACQNNQQNSNATDSQASPAKNLMATPDAKRKTIVFFGTSLTAAYQLSPEQGFPALIQQKIDSLNLPYQCVNAGLSGETSVDGKNRIDWVLQQPVDIFVLELGANDALRGLPVETAKHNLQTIIDRVKSKYPDCQFLIVGMQAPPNLGASYTKAFASMFPDLAKTNQAALVPFLLEGVGGEPSLNLSDGIHPNEAGHQILAENVWKVLKSML